MKIAATITLLLSIVITYGQQNIVYQNGQIPSIKIGSPIKLLLLAQTEESKFFLSDKKFEIRIGNSIMSSDKYKVSSVDNTNFIVEFNSPEEMGLLGQNKDLLLSNGVKDYNLKISFYADPPVMKNMRSSNTQNTSTMIFYNDIGDYQDIIIEVDDVTKVKKIKFTDGNLQIKGSGNTNEIDYSNSDFRTDIPNNLIYIKASLKNVQSLSFIMTYLDSSFNDTPTSEQLVPRDINFLAKYPGGAMSVTPKIFYADDFNIENATPDLTLDLSSSGRDGLNYDFSLVNSIAGSNLPSQNINIKSLNTNRASYNVGKPIIVSLPTTITTGRYIVMAAPGGNVINALRSEIVVLPQPSINGIVVRNAVNNNELVRKKGNTYTITVKGPKLQQMQDLKYYMVCKTNPSVKIYSLTPDAAILEDAVNITLNFGDDNFHLIDAGDYEIRIARRVPGGFEKTYLNDYTIKVVYPKLMASNQTLPDYVGLSNTAVFYDSKIFFKDEKNGKRKLLKPESPIILKIKPSPEIVEKGPQYLNVEAVYYQSNGNKTTVTWTEGDSNSLIVKDQDVTYNLKAAFNLQDSEPLNIGEKIVVSVRHSPIVYGKNNTDEKQTFIYYRKDSFIERIGFTASLPPYIAVGRRVSKKTVVKDDQGNITDVTFDESSKKFQMQNLVLNAGIGFKFRFKKDNYEPSNFALGAYVMGLNFADSDNSDDQLNNPESNDFVRNRSFNAMILGQFDIVNLDVLNAKIPVYLGPAYIFDPLDNGSKFAWVFGLGIDITIGD
ncbi:hypothetical protein [Flavobacterium subsaxonicum]|uniref:Uncharacterized protein n=1 Tax=Flavobacterium subsaxonicum WB 4.1-42 = DSM 21790 TaxID=1121898 RepID=A0A0A2MKP2_9FLAO|nr:hypothetical protein [Flavobacterium subsaxonicum]KGO93177.1 hypothetical protein Q766_07650 [Flavobacterium subsaxonicum WB 4.1-42 = DSM 21790]